MSQQTQTIQYIPLNRLVASPRNVRRRHARADIESLAASIDARGLLQNLCVVAGENDRFEVEAGGRRRLALKLLAKSGRIAKDWPVPCHVVSREDGREVSLTENVHRVAMDAMDEVDAYAALVEEGKSREDIARRFGVELRHVDQRLALAGLSPKIKAAWKRGDVSLEAARAFCLVADHARQEAVFRSLGRPVNNPSSVRARLMDGRVRVSDRLAVFVGVEAYESAGGKIVRDLFESDAAYVDDPALLARLAEDRLEALAPGWLARGWSWVDIDLGQGANDISATRLHPEWRDPTSEEQAELDRLAAEIERLDMELEASSVEDDERWRQRDDLEAAFETIRQAGRCWAPELMALSGVVLSIDRDGGVAASEGLVRSADEKHVREFLRKRRAGDDAGQSEETDAADAPPARGSALPKTVCRDLTLARTRVIRLLLAGEPDVALALCVAAMAQRSMRCAEIPGVAIAAHALRVEDLPEYAEARSRLDGGLPSEGIDVLEWALDQSRERLLDALAILVAGAVDLSHEHAGPADIDKQTMADRLSQHLDIDMSRYWKADLDYWTRLPKAALIAAMLEAPGMTERSERTREDAIKAFSKLRKDELAAKATAAFEGTNYLPDILVTPVGAGGIAITPEGAAAIALPSVAAE